MRDEIVKYYKISQSKISITYNGIAEHMLVAGGITRQAKEKIILSVGTFNKRKNHQSLVRAFLESKIKDEYQLVMVGDRNKVFSESGFHDNDLLTGNVTVYEHFTNEDLIAMYRKAEVIVSLSMYEGFGVPVLEGIYFGCKAICSDIAVYRELFDSCAVFCDPVDKKQIADTLLDITQASITGTAHCAGMLSEKYSYKRSAEIIVERRSSTRAR